jgi:beta-lactamase regulating signal transducer with metallopeptidase domain
MNVVQMSLSAAFMIAATVILRALLMYRLPKGTFLALWGVALCRLLIPFSVPAKTSIFGLMDYIGARMAGSPAGPAALRHPGETTVPANTASDPVAGAISDDAISVLPPLFFVWLAGAVIFGAYFTIAYCRCHRRFSASLPCDNSFVAAWREKHRLKRTYAVRVSDKIELPLTYGIFRPVILLPKGTDFADEERLSYVLMHEWTHIRRFDALIKLLATAALCVHWFNPLVFVMYILLNRDIEISCDERVLRAFGETPKSAYALTLIGMEEKKSACLPLCSAFSKYAIEERIHAIMKMKKGSFAGMLIAALLVVGTMTVFATSAAGSGSTVENSNFKTAEAYARVNAPGGDAPEAPYPMRGDISAAKYLYTLGFLEGDADDFRQIYSFNGKWVRAVYDPNIWNGYNYSRFSYQEADTRYGESVGVKVIRDEQTNEIRGLAELSASELDAVREKMSPLE